MLPQWIFVTTQWDEGHFHLTVTAACWGTLKRGHSGTAMQSWTGHLVKGVLGGWNSLHATTKSRALALLSHSYWRWQGSCLGQNLLGLWFLHLQSGKATWLLRLEIMYISHLKYNTYYDLHDYYFCFSLLVYSISIDFMSLSWQPRE